MLRYKNRWFGRAKIQAAISQVEGRAQAYYAALLWHLKHGDGSAWEQFVGEWGTRLYSYLRYNTACEEDAQRVLSETMLLVVHEIINFDEKNTLAAFVYQLAYRKVKEYWYTCGKPDLQLRFSRLVAGVDFPEMRKTWSQLEEQSLQLILLHYQANLSINEIADVLGRSFEVIEAMLAQLHDQFQNRFLSSAGV